MPLDPYFQSSTKPDRFVDRVESDAQTMGRLDAQLGVYSCPFEKGSRDAQEWREAHQAELKLKKSFERIRE